MSYEVLARRLRPGQFDSLIGQEHVIRALRHALNEDRVHHAYLFTGTRGVGKTTIARIVAKALNCERGVSADPCGECGACVAIRDNRFIDLIEVDAASRTGVDDTRELLENAQYLPSQGRFKVYLIDEVHMLSINSFNALLKTLEEPPEHVKFLLATTDPKKVPPTVLSRCLQFQLKNISAADIAGYLGTVLTDESIAFEDGAVEVISRAAAGSMRDALSLTDQAIAHGEGSLTTKNVTDMLGIAGRDEVGAVLQAVSDGLPAGVLEVTAELAEKGTDFIDLLKQVIAAIHKLAVDDALNTGDGNFSSEEIQLYYQIALLGFRDIQFAPDERSGFEMTMLRMLAFAPDGPAAVKTRSDESEAASQPESEQVPVKERNPHEDEGPESATQTAEQVEQVEQVTQKEAPAVEAQVLSPGLGAWYDMVAQLEIAGVTRMIAEHSEMLEFEPPVIRLRLDLTHDTLLNDGQVNNLRRALSDLHDFEVQLDIQTGEVASETPAKRDERVRLERQQQAEEQIRKDVNVQNLMAEFDARVDEVRPVQR